MQMSIEVAENIIFGVSMYICTIGDSDKSASIAYLPSEKKSLKTDQIDR